MGEKSETPSQEGQTRTSIKAKKGVWERGVRLVGRVMQRREILIKKRRKTDEQKEKT